MIRNANLGVTMKKKENLKPRGARLSDEQWAKLERLGKKNQCTPSDVLRSLIDNFDERKTK